MLMPTLDETTHTYRMADGRIVPGVTQVLTLAGIIDPTYYTEESRARGTAVHAAIQYHVEGTLDEDTVDPRIRPYFEAYKLFALHSRIQPIHCEKVVYSHTQDYASRIDMLCQWPDGIVSLLEFKTGTRPKWVDIQLAAQQQACFESGMRPTRLYSLELRATGCFDLKEHKAHEGLHWFLAARKKVREMHSCPPSTPPSCGSATGA